MVERNYSRHANMENRFEKIAIDYPLVSAETQKQNWISRQKPT